MSKVSILVPIYGVEKYIERCAVSLFEQTFDDIEYIFVNDCTPDRSVDILKETIERYPNRKSQVIIIDHKRNKGLAGARNTGIENARGEYILHVDSDDYLDLDAVNLFFTEAIKNDSDVVVSDYILEWDKEKKYVTQGYNDDKNKFLKLILSGEASPCVWNKFFRRSLYIENKIEAKEGLNFGEDLYVTPKLIYFSEKIFKINTPLYYYTQTNVNSYTREMSKKNIDNVIDVLKNLTCFFENKKEYNYFSNSILEGKLKKKIELIFESDIAYWDELFNIFPEVNSLNSTLFLKCRDRIVYKLVNNNLKNCLIFYRGIYKALFRIIQKIKGR